MVLRRGAALHGVLSGAGAAVGGGSEAEAAIDREASVPPVSQEGVVDIFALAQCHFCLCLNTSKE